MKTHMLRLSYCVLLTFACGGTSQQSFCGDGAVDTQETCDDGNTANGDGCSSDCGSNETCGNGAVDVIVGEACDDGNTTDGDGCQGNCALPGCGDGTTDPAEACDDGNTTSGDGCSGTCMSDETCGNNVIDPGEVCDDGNTNAGDGCSASCQAEYCGNNNVDPGEACDDGNTTSGDGCNANCSSDETCGNGVLDVGESCDDGNVVDLDGCQANCAPTTCVDRGLVECNSICINANTDEDFCGATGDCMGGNAGMVCGGGEICAGGLCTLSCQAGLMACNGTCIDPNSNPNYCGATGACQGGVACGSGQACFSGTCVDLSCVFQRAGFLGGAVGPVFTDGCWTQCTGIIEQPGGDEVPVAWGADCMLGSDNKLRIVCGDAALTSYRYIDVSKNVFRDLLASYPESGLITDARDQANAPFTIESNDIYAAGNDPNAAQSWWAGPSGCGNTNNLTVNNVCTREAANCFGLANAIGTGDIFLGVYVQQ